MKFSDARIKFYEEVKAFHETSGLDPRYHRSALEQYFKSCGGNPWSLTDQDHEEYSAWRQSLKKMKFSDARIKFYEEVKAFHETSGLDPGYHRSALEQYFKSCGGNPWSLTDQDHEEYSAWRQSLKKIKFSDARIKFYEEVKAFHETSGLDPRYHRSALEQYFKSCGGNPWSLTDQDHEEYYAWRQSLKKMKFSDARIKFYEEVKAFHETSGLDPGYHRSALEQYFKSCGGNPWSLTDQDHEEYSAWRQSLKKIKFSDARIKFYEEVKAFHETSGLDPRYHRSALEQYFKSCGGNPWSLTDQDHEEYSA